MTLVYRFEQTATGYPDYLYPTVRGLLRAVLKSAKPGDRPRLERLLNGELQLTVSTEGTATVYILKAGGDIVAVSLFRPEGMANYDSSTRQVSVRSNNLELVPSIPIPPFRVDFPCVWPFYLERPQRNAGDDFFQIPVGTPLVNVYRPGVSIGRGKLPYVGGAWWPKESRVTQGPPKDPALEIRFVGEVSLSGITFPRQLTVRSSGMMGGKTLRDAVHVVDTQSYTLVSARPEALPEDAFHIETYMDRGTLAENGKRGISFKKGASLEEQLTDVADLNPPKPNRSGSLFAWMLVGALTLTAGIVWWRRSRRT